VASWWQLDDPSDFYTNIGSCCVYRKLPCSSNIHRVDAAGVLHGYVARIPIVKAALPASLASNCYQAMAPAEASYLCIIIIPVLDTHVFTFYILLPAGAAAHLSG
jgi:hypothetical protein